MVENTAGVAPAVPAPRDAGTPGGLFSLLRRLFAGDREQEKRRALKKIARYVKKYRPRLYEPRRGMVEPPLAELAYDLQRTLIAAQNLFAGDNRCEVMKAVVINGSMSDRQLDISSRIQDGTLRERVAQHSFGKIVKEVKSELGAFVKEFDRNKVLAIEERYHNIRVLLDLARFDYVLFLRRFDSAIATDDPNSVPSFGRCEGRQIAEQLIGFAQLIGRVDCTADWDGAIEMLRVYKGPGVISREKWIRALRKIKRLQESDILSLVIRLIENDPEFSVETGFRRERIVTPYLSKFKLQAALSLEKIQRELKGRRTEKLLWEVFGDRVLPELSHYTEAASVRLAKRNLPGYRYVNELRYTKAFLTDFYKSRIRELIRTLVVKGEWKDTLMARHLSDSNQQLIEKLGALRQLDGSLAEDKQTGAKLKNAIYSMIRNRANRPVAKNLIDQINTKAGEIICDICGNLTAMKTMFRKIYAALTGESEDVLYNREVLIRHCGEHLPEEILEIAQKIDAFVKMAEIRQAD